MGLNVADTTIHAWDLARALGVDERLDAGLVERAGNLFAPLADMVRAPMMYGPAVEVTAAADAQARLLAMVGGGRDTVDAPDQRRIVTPDPGAQGWPGMASAKWSKTTGRMISIATQMALGNGPEMRSASTGGCGDERSRASGGGLGPEPVACFLCGGLREPPDGHRELIEKADVAEDTVQRDPRRPARHACSGRRTGGQRCELDRRACVGVGRRDIDVEDCAHSPDREPGRSRQRARRPGVRNPSRHRADGTP